MSSYEIKQKIKTFVKEQYEQNTLYNKIEVLDETFCFDNRKDKLELDLLKEQIINKYFEEDLKIAKFKKVFEDPCNHNLGSLKFFLAVDWQTYQKVEKIEKNTKQWVPYKNLQKQYKKKCANERERAEGISLPYFMKNTDKNITI